MGDEQFVVERADAPKRPAPLVSLPRGRQRDLNGVPVPPVVDVFVEFAKATAGCCVCDKPIPKGTTRLSLRVALREAITAPDGQRRITERYYLHPGCVTDRVRPEVIRFGVDCYDCGAVPPQAENGMTLRWTNYCFTVSRFSPAHLCLTCAAKPKWSQCDLCQIHFPPWMISTIARPDTPQPEPPVVNVSAFEALIAPTVRPDANSTCEYCARRFKITTAAEAAQAEEDFMKLREQIRKDGFYEAGDE